MGNDDIVVGKSPSNRTPKPVIVEKLAKRAGTSAPAEPSSSVAPERHCGAMSQQPYYGGATSTPQKFLRLVGCHEPKDGPKDAAKAKSPAGRVRAR